MRLQNVRFRGARKLGVAFAPTGRAAVIAGERGRPEQATDGREPNVYIYIYIYIYMYIHIPMYNLCVCIHIYIYIYTYIHTYLHTYISRPRGDRKFGGCFGFWVAWAAIPVSQF